MTTRSGHPYTAEQEVNSGPTMTDMFTALMQKMEAQTTQMTQRFDELSDRVTALEHVRPNAPPPENQNQPPVFGNRPPPEGRQFQGYDSDEDYVQEEIPHRGRQGRRHYTPDDDIVRQVRIEAPLFDGSLDPQVCKDWLQDMDQYFSWYDFPEARKVRFAKMKLVGNAKQFWLAEEIRREQNRRPPIDQWEVMKRKFVCKYVPESFCDQLKAQFVALKQGSMSGKSANVLTPAVLAEEASKIASAYSDVLTANILDVKQCEELKMGSYLAVAAASTNPPRFIHLCYKPPGGNAKTKLAIVGKGLTFDSGGYNIKTGPGCMIELMKFDMGGSAATLGAAKAIAQIKPPGVEVHFIVAACENMISGTGMRPGDIVTASNGKTIEVNNTDAEGRLTLADALVYACNQGVDKIVDLATLTGACIIALGSNIAGVFSPNDELIKEVQEASEVTGEKFWRLPLEESYWENMKSGVADMANAGGRQGGSIIAALFLKQFVDEKVKWMHIDMAGPVWNEKKRTATGFGVSTLVQWVLKNSSS